MVSDNVESNLSSRIGTTCWGTNPASISTVPDVSKCGARWLRATRQTQMDTLTTGTPGKFDFAKGGEHSIDLALSNGMSIMSILDARWDTESGPGGAVIGHAVATPDEYEGLFNIYRHCFAYEHGLDRYFWFNATGGDHAPESGGARDSSGKLTRRYQALKTLHDAVGEGGLTEARHLGPDVHAYRFEGPNGPVSIVWSTAPSKARLSGGAVDATDYLGNPAKIGSEFELSGLPLFFHGDVLSRLDATSIGVRDTVSPTLRPAPRDTPQATSFRTPTPLADLDHAWAAVPYFTRSTDCVSPETEDHFYKLASPVPADVQLAHDDQNLYLRARTFDPHFDPAKPFGLVQFTLRDQNPDVLEWGYYYNSYGHWNLLASDHGAKVLRYEHLLIDDYPSGSLANVPVTVKVLKDGLLFTAAVPWRVIGPVTPGRHNPFFMRFNFTRADHSLARPQGDTVEEQAHDFSELLICRSPQLSRFVIFE